MMEVRAVAKYVRVQPRKVRIIADEIRGKSATYAVHLLRYHPSKSAAMLRKVLVSAIANAMENNNMAPESLKIATITVDEGPRTKRIQARAMGRANRIVKKTSHITVGVEEMEAKPLQKTHGTKPKPRPTLAAPAPKKSSKKKAEDVVEATAPVEETVVEETVVEETPVAEETVTEAPAAEEVQAEDAEKENN